MNVAQISGMRTRVKHVLGSPRSSSRYKIVCACGHESAWHTHAVYLRKVEAHAKRCSA